MTAGSRAWGKGVKGKGLKGPGETETVVAAPVLGPDEDVAAVGGARVPGVAVPGAAAQHAAYFALIRLADIAVLHPFPHIAMHVEEPPGVGGKAAHRGGLLAVPSAAAAVAVGAIVTDLVAPGISGLGPGAGGVLPFGLRGQAPDLAGLAG